MIRKFARVIIGFTLCVAAACIEPKSVAEENAKSDGQMVETVLRDKQGNRLGTIEIYPDGRQIARDKLGNRVGEYNPQENLTRDRLGKRYGEGNLLAGLIAEAKR